MTLQNSNTNTHIVTRLHLFYTYLFGVDPSSKMHYWAHAYPSTTKTLQLLVTFKWNPKRIVSVRAFLFKAFLFAFKNVFRVARKMIPTSSECPIKLEINISSKVNLHLMICKMFWWQILIMFRILDTRILSNGLISNISTR